MPQVLEDAFLLRRFPGRFLHEIDGIDYPRHQLAWEAEAIYELERRRDAHLAGRAELSPEEWQRIREHENLLRDYGWA